MNIIAFITTIILTTITPIIVGMSPKIMGGSLVKRIEDFPYQVGILLDSGHFCGGTLIDNNNVLTASHCVVNTKYEIVKPSSIDIFSSTTNFSSHSSVWLKPKYVFTHKDFSYQTMQNDIAVIRIEKVNFNAKLKAVRLANWTMDDWTPCNVSGWGAVNPNSSVSSYLNFVTVPLIQPETCRRNSSYGSVIRDGMLCAGYPQGNKDACYGDSGGPLVCNGMLAGVVSWGRSCGEPNYYGVYTNVYKYRNWIQTQIQRSSSPHQAITNNALFFIIIMITSFIPTIL